MCSGWYSNQRWTIDGRDFHLRPERGFRYRDRDAAVNVVTNPCKERMWRRIDHNVEITARSPETPGIAFTCHPNSGPCGDSRRQRDFQSFAATNASFTVALIATLKIFARAAAFRASYRELKVSFNSRGFAGTAAGPAAEFT